MPLYKVWNGSRSVRKVVKGDSLNELLEKGKEKLAFAGTTMVRLVLNEDGTDVDDQEILDYFESQTLLMLSDGEVWQSPSSQDSLGSNKTEPGKTATDAHDVPPHKSPLHKSADENPETQQTSSSAITSRKGCTELPHASRIELPQFSPNVTLMLLQNNDDSAMDGVLREASMYYHIKYPNMKEAAYYQAIGEKLVKKYKCLAGYDGNKPWSYLSSKLSSRIRQLRTKSNKKSTVGSTAAPRATSTPQAAAKKFRLASDVPIGRKLSEEEFEERVGDIKAEWEGRRELAQLRVLMADTRTNRQDQIKVESVADVVKTYPTLQDGCFVQDEFCAMTNKGKEALDERTEIFFDKVAELLPNAAKGSGETATSVGLLEALERRVAITQGKGVKSRSVLTKIKMDTIDVPEDTLLKKLQVAARQPFALKAITQDEVIKMIYIVGEGTYIDSKTTNACKAVVRLLGAYYVFGRHYPEIYGQLLGFIQQQILMEPYPFAKGTHFQTFSKKFHGK